MKCIIRLFACAGICLLAACSGPGKTGSAETNNIVSDTVKTPSPEGFDQRTTDTVAAGKISNFLVRYFEKNIQFMDSTDRKYSFYALDLNGDDKPEYLISLRGRSFCGTGGCTFIIMNSDMQIINYITTMSTPVFRSSGVTNGWNDLIIIANALPGEETYRHLKFDSKRRRYPSNASMVEETKMAPSGHDFIMWDDEFSKAKTFTF